MVKISRSGGIYIEISGDTKKLKEQLDEINRKAKATGGEISKNLSGNVDASGAAQAINSLSRSMARAQQAAKAMNADFASQEAELRKLGKEIGISKGRLDEFVSLQLKGLKANFTKNFGRELRNIQRQTGMSTAEMNKLSKSLGGAGGEFERASRSSQKLCVNMSSLAVEALKVASALATVYTQATGI